MRLVLSSLVAAGLLGSQIASAACIPPVDRAALDVAGLKTMLMVQTLTCKSDDKYNAFINKFKPTLVSDESTAKSYFVKKYGRTGQKQLDEYMTNLANSKSDSSMRDGSRFCPHNEEVFSEVLALKNGDELTEYAAGRATATPASYTSCEATPARTTRTTRRAAPSRHR